MQSEIRLSLMMKWLTLLVTVFLLSAGCESRQKQEEFRKREAALNEKEQELLLKEKTLALKEEELLQRQQKIDSTVIDTAHQNPVLSGIWTVSMTCTETSCTGYAVGDTRTDQWQISYEGNTIIAKVMAEDKLLRTYTGFYTGNTVELVENRPNAEAHPETKMVVRLRIINNLSMEGEREIIREDCKVIYSLKLDKQK